MQNVKLLVSTPMYGGQCFGAYTASMLALQRACVENGIDFGWNYLGNESLITRGRDYLVYQFLETDATHLLFIDADLSFFANDVMRMIDADEDIVCGVYSRKEIDWHKVEHAVKMGVPTEHLKHFAGYSFTTLLDKEQINDSLDYQSLVPIKHGGTGFMLIKREVFEKLQDQVPTYETEKGEVVSQFFDTSFGPKDDSEYQELLSEDYHFCKLWRENGGKIFAASWTWLDHYGTYIFSGGFGRMPSSEVT